MTDTLSHVGAIKLLSEENEALRKANRTMAADLGHYRMWWETKAKPLLAAAKGVVANEDDDAFDRLVLAIEAMEGDPIVGAKL